MPASASRSNCCREFLVERQGQPAMQRLFRGLEAGVDSMPVEKNRALFEANVGASLPAFERDFRAWLQPACH